MNETGESTTLFEHENTLEKFNYGISFGLGYKFKLNDKDYLTLELRDDLGLANIAIPSAFELKTNTLKLLVNWELSI